MKVLYQLTIPRPAMPECEAVWQEINLLRDRFGGDLVYINPSQNARVRVPRFFFGFHRLRALRTLEEKGEIDLYHVFNPDPYPFGVLKWLRRPVVYTLSGGLDSSWRPKVQFFRQVVHTVVVASETERRVLAAWGLDNVCVVRPGIDAARFTHSPFPLETEGIKPGSIPPLRLMVGSAPWVKGQFRTKGIEALLDAARTMQELRLVFLWRGVLADDMAMRVRRRGLDERVKVLNRRVDVNSVLARVHASVVLAEKPSIVKAYPNSLLESLAAGKPVLVSRDVPLAELVAETGCGRVVTRVTPNALLEALEALALDYDAACASALQVGQTQFSHEQMLADYYGVYRNVLNGR